MKTLLPTEKWTETCLEQVQGYLQNLWMHILSIFQNGCLQDVRTEIFLWWRWSVRLGDVEVCEAREDHAPHTLPKGGNLELGHNVTNSMGPNNIIFELGKMEQLYPYSCLFLFLPVVFLHNSKSIVLRLLKFSDFSYIPKALPLGLKPGFTTNCLSPQAHCLNDCFFPVTNKSFFLDQKSGYLKFCKIFYIFEMAWSRGFQKCIIFHFLDKFVFANIFTIL